MCLFCGDMRHFAADTVSGEVFLNNEDRGETGPNGKPSLTSQEAGVQLGRVNQTWNGFGEGVLGREATVSFAFRDTAPAQMPNGTSGFTRFNQTQIDQTLLALQSWSDVANIDFVRAGAGAYFDSATMLFGNYSAGASGAAAFAYLPNVRNPNGAPGDSWYNSTLSYNANPQHLNYGRLVITHEIGHAIGLLHPGDYNAGQGRPTYANSAQYFEDTLQYSVMSYWSERNTGADFKGFYSSGPLMDDISAVQRLYGANMTTRTGNDTYGFNSTTGIDYYTANDAQTPLIFSVWDAGGYDTFDFSGYRQNQLIDLREGAFSNVGGLVGNVSIAPGVVIEQAIGGSGNDTIVGNGASNVLIGGAGDDRLYSGTGGSMNVLDGGTGHDTAIMALDLTDYARGFNAALNPVLYVSESPSGGSELRQIDRYEFADGGFDIDRGDDLFDSFFYMQSNADVYASGTGALAHYLEHGAAEGRDPSAYFDGSLYSALYGGEFASGQSALDHYRSEGAARGFAPSAVFDAQRYLEIHADVAAAGADALSHYMAFGRAEGRATVAAFERGPAADGFDELFYLVTNADVAVAGVDARQHYAEFGARENRDPNGIFDTAFYLQTNEDVAAARVDPLAHYHQFGWREGRDPSSTFDTAAHQPSLQIARGSFDSDPVVDFLRSAEGLTFSSADPYFV